MQLHLRALEALERGEISYLGHRWPTTCKEIKHFFLATIGLLVHALIFLGGGVKGKERFTFLKKIVFTL